MHHLKTMKAMCDIRGLFFNCTGVPEREKVQMNRDFHITGIWLTKTA